MRTQPDPNSKRQRCLRTLADGPATSGEVAAELGIDSKLASTHLYHLFREGRITRAPFGGKTVAGHSVWLWSLPA